MAEVILTQYDGKILGPIAKLLGYILNGIFIVLDKIGIPNVGLAIILFTIVIYMALMPLTIKQQKFSKLSAKMNPEIQAIQAKYKNKKDQESMMKMNEETKAVYAKYGVSPSGSCVQLLIQMPILFALYRVIYNVPAYVGKVKDAFIPFVSAFIKEKGALDFIQNSENFQSAAQFSKQFTNELFVAGDNNYVTNTVIDVLNKASSSEWQNIFAAGNFPGLKELINNGSTGAFDLINHYNNFLGINIGDSPSFLMKDAFSAGHYGAVIGALLIPVLAALTQWLNTKLMPQPEQGNDDNNAMASSMKTMNVMMPIMSAVFCFTLPAGMGLYWIAGAVIRSFQQVAINKRIDKIDIDALVKKNTEKYNEKRAKMGLPAETVNNNARISTKSVVSTKPQKSQAEREEALRKATEYYNKGVKPGSLAAKANMVKQYNEKNNSN